MSHPPDSFSDDSPSPPPFSAPRFGLRTLLLSTALVALVLACFRSFGALPTAILLLAAASIVAHVAANAIGMRLRVHGPRRSASPPPDPDTPAVRAAPLPHAPTTRLSERTSLVVPLSVGSAVGALLGGTIGFTFFASHEQDKATLADTVLGAMAFALLGAMALAICTAFVLVMWSAWRAASRHG